MSKEDDITVESY